MSVEPDVLEEKVGDGQRKQPNGDSTSDQSAEGWKFLWDSEKEFDQEKVDSWKDELNNLLVFAGLFSAVVTAFAVESYQLLQQDPADRSNELLERISLQLASFTVGPGFINATQALTPPTPFQPDPISSAINALWFLSLTLSLLAAFFAIAAQQWLRSLLLPRHLSLTNRMRLRQSRHEALILCQIPQIISFLPVTLQVAVLMFLIGLYLFLRNLQYTIATTFAVVAGIPFLLYGLSLFMPLFWPSCTYKSPIVPVASAALRWAICIAAWVAFFAFFLPLFLLFSLCLKPIIGFRHPDRARRQSWRMTAMEFFYAIIWPIFLMSTRFTETIEDFWVDREVRWLRREKEKKLSEIDQWSLSWAPQSVPRDQLRRLAACIGDLSLKRRCTAVVHWTMFELGDYGEAGYSSWFVYSPIKTELLKKVDHAFADDYKDLLMLTLPKEWTPAIWREAAESLPLVLVLLMQIVKTSSLDGESRGPIVRHMIEACKSQEIGAITREKADEDIRDTMRYPAVCLYGSIEDEGYNFSAEETGTLMTLATTRIQECSAFEDKLVDDLLVDISDTVFGLTATSLIALSQQPTTTDAHTSLLPALLSSLNGHVTTQSRELRSMARVCSHNPDEPLLITPRAIASVSRSLVRLRETDRIPSPAMEQCDSLVANLTSLCTECLAFAGALEPLQRFKELKRSRKTEALAGSSDGQGYSADSLEKIEGRSPRNADTGQGSLPAVEGPYK